MSARTKKILFWAFTVLFFLSIPIGILVTQGYRIDFNTLRIVKTGGIDVGIENVEARVFVDGKLKKETNFIFRNAIIRNILPNTYTVRVEKNGYRDWEKRVEVEEGQVAKFPAVRLFPNALMPHVISENTTENFAISPNKKFALMTQTTHISPATESVSRVLQIQLLNLEHGNSPKPLITLEAGETVESLRWADAGSVFYIHTQSSLSQRVYTGSIEQPDTLINWSAFLRRSYIPALSSQNYTMPSNNLSVLWVFIHGEDGSFSVSELNIDKGIIRPNIVTSIVTSQIVRENLFYVNARGMLLRTYLPTGSSLELSPTAITKVDTRGGAHIVVRDDQQAVMVLNKGDLFLWREGASFSKIGENINDAQFSPDRKKLMFWNQAQVVVYWLEEAFGPPKREKGRTEIVNIPQGQGIQTVFWFGKEPNHIVIQTNNELMVTELDSRDHRNIVSYSIALAPASINHEIVTLDNDRGIMYGMLLPEKRVVLLNFQ